MIKEIPYIPPFNKTFSEFLNKHEKIILKLFNIVASFKNDIPNTYKYSLKYPPKKRIYKYTDKLFIGCILYIILNNVSWISFIGPIPGKQVHKRFKEYIEKFDCFNKLFNKSIEEYLCTNAQDKLNIISADSTNVYNKLSSEIEGRNPYFKNKKCSKISAIVDSYGTPISISVNNGNTHDCKLFNEVFDKMFVNEKIKENIHKKTIFLADKGYDTKFIRNKLRKKKIRTIIAFNKRNTKNGSKLRSLSNNERKIYKKRIKVEHYFGIIKRYPKINNIYEKSLQSYWNIVLLVSSMLILNRI